MKQRVETVDPSEVSCAHYSDKWVSSTSSSAEDETTEESIKEEGDDEYLPDILPECRQTKRKKAEK